MYTPLNQQVAYCAVVDHQRSSLANSFPCDGSPLQRARFVLSHLHLSPSRDSLVLACQLVQLAGVLVLMSDLLRVSWPSRWEPWVSHATLDLA
jgi:hypothetical protein